FRRCPGPRSNQGPRMKISLPWIALLLLVLVSVVALAPRARARQAASPNVPAQAPTGPAFHKVVKTPDEWRKQLTGEQFKVLRQAGTEIAFTGAWWNEHRKGSFVCAGCGLPLFGSDTKFDSGTGWPSY